MAPEIDFSETGPWKLKVASIAVSLLHRELSSKNIMGMCSCKGELFHWARLTIMHLHFLLSC